MIGGEKWQKILQNLIVQKIKMKAGVTSYIFASQDIR